MADANLTGPNGSPFDTVVMVRIDGHWHFVETAEQAFRCLIETFTGPGGPSHARALDTCEAFRAKMVSQQSVQAAFVVAAMASGYPFEILQRDEALMERQVAAAAEDAILAALP
jgi:hypothetical protein